MNTKRLILFHKQDTSARTRFLKFAYESVCAFEALPLRAVLLEATDIEPSRIAIHPAAFISKAEQQLGLPSGSLETEGEYHARVDVAGGPIDIFLARFTSLDPPFEMAESIGAEFIDLTQARGLPRVELELLRKAYELVIG